MFNKAMEIEVRNSHISIFYTINEAHQLEKTQIELYEVSKIIKEENTIKIFTQDKKDSKFILNGREWAPEKLRKVFKDLIVSILTKYPYLNIIKNEKCLEIMINK